MSLDINAKFEELRKALEAGGLNAAPGTLNQGSSLQMQDLSNVMNVTCISDDQIKLQKMFPVKAAKQTMYEFRRQLDYGTLGSSAVLEGAVGEEETPTYVSAIVPMAYYVHYSRRTLQAELVNTFDGKGPEERLDEAAATKLAWDIEKDCFLGKAMYSNAGAFDGNILATPDRQEAGMRGFDQQVRSSDSDITTHDLFFQEYGGNESVVLDQSGVLSQDIIEDVKTLNALHNGNAKTLVLGPTAHGNYNKIAFPKERIILAGSPQKRTGASLDAQDTVQGQISIESSRMLEPKTAPSRLRGGTPAAPTAAAATDIAAAGTSFIAGEQYTYFVTAVNARGEGAKSASQVATIAATGDGQSIVITPAAGLAAISFNVYRSEAGGSKTAFIGRVKAQGAAAVTFIDLNYMKPFMSSAYAVDERSSHFAELSSFKSKELAQTDLTTPKAYYRFVTLGMHLPRFNVIVDNCR